MNKWKLINNNKPEWKKVFLLITFCSLREHASDNTLLLQQDESVKNSK